MDMDFGSENTSPVHPSVVEAVVRTNAGFATNFESDSWTERALRRLKEVFECELDAFTVSTGTAANAIALGAMTPPWGTILCHWDAHIETDECGAPEMFTHGARQIPLPGEHGRMDPVALRRCLEEARWGDVHALQPAALSLTNLTEAGTAYSPEQIAELAGIARRHNLLVHLDGARFANALAFHGATAAEMTWKAGVDVFCLGTTKSGTFGAETIISFRRELSEKLAFIRKRGGHFAPKSRFLAAQVEAYFADDLWLRNARHANAAATRLATGLRQVPGVDIVHSVEGNEVFASMPAPMTEALLAAGAKFQRDWRLRPRQNRFVTSWASEDAAVDRLVAVCRECKNEDPADRRKEHVG